MKTSAEKRELNKSEKTKVSSQRKKLFEAIASGKKAECEEQYRVYSAVLDKAAKKGIISKNTASRRRSRAALRIASL